MNLRNIRRRARQGIYLLAYRALYIRRIETNLLRNWVEFKSVRKVADIACGKGLISLLLSRDGRQVYGLDLDRSNIVFARSIDANSNCEFQVGNAQDLPYRNGVFDLLVCNCALEHFEDDERAFLEMNRVLRTNGKIFLTVDSFSCEGLNEHLKDIHRSKFVVVTYYSLPEIAERLSAVGFEIKRYRYYVRSKLSRAICNSLIRVRSVRIEDVMSILAFPIVYPLIVLSDRLSSEPRGYYLAVLAERCDGSAAGGSATGTTPSPKLDCDAERV